MNTKNLDMSLVAEIVQIIKVCAYKASDVQIKRFGKPGVDWDSPKESLEHYTEIFLVKFSGHVDLTAWSIFAWGGLNNLTPMAHKHLVGLGAQHPYLANTVRLVRAIGSVDSVTVYLHQRDRFADQVVDPAIERAYVYPQLCFADDGTFYIQRKNHNSISHSGLFGFIKK